MDENNFNNQGENQNIYGNGQPPQQPYQQSSYNQPQFSQPEPFAQPMDFTQPQYGYAPAPAEPEMSIKDWIITFLIMMIPCVNVVMMFVWAFSNTNKTRGNFFKAYLIIMAVMAALGVVFAIVFGSALAIFMSEIAYYL